MYPRVKPAKAQYKAETLPAKSRGSRDGTTSGSTKVYEAFRFRHGRGDLVAENSRQFRLPRLGQVGQGNEQKNGA